MTIYEFVKRSVCDNGVSVKLERVYDKYSPLCKYEVTARRSGSFLAHRVGVYNTRQTANRHFKLALIEFGNNPAVLPEA